MISARDIRALPICACSPFDKIRIDQWFVEISHEEGRHSHCAAIIGVASSLDMVTTAEGVETEEQLAIYSQKAAPKCKAT